MDAQFAQHIGIAQQQLGVYVGSAKTFETAVRRFVAAGGRVAQTHGEAIVISKFEQAASTAQSEAQNVWIEIWQQLDQAREIASQRGRDVTAYDQARGESRKLGAGALFDGGEWQRVPFSADVAVKTVEWHAAPHALVSKGIDALRGAMPEVVIPEAAASMDIPQLKSSSKILWVIAAIAIAAAIALVVVVMQKR